MWANFSTQRDLEIFKRNIYPGNGIGVAQFLGGDLDDGWSTMASIDVSEIDHKKFGYLDRLSGSSWSGLIQESSKPGSVDASSALEKATAKNVLTDSSHAMGTSQILAGAVSAIAVAANPTPLTIGLGAGLLKTMSGRGGANLMKTLGLVSDLDDDIYDEVSFRAQTYMRSVWDMFQMCARLLPNYIVAVRPFEERSTIFYGKPHWLYTSGVMPISTGFPSEEQAKLSGTSVPGYVAPDDELSKLLYSLNKELSPSSDAIASLDSKESSLSESLASLSKDMLSFSGVFRPAKNLQYKVIDFKDATRNVYYVGGKPISRLPINKGRVQVGFHLPFNSTGKGTSVGIQSGYSEPSLNHKQIPQLPIRYSYPFFTNRTSGTLPSLNFDRIFNKNSEFEIKKNMNNLLAISEIESKLVATTPGKKGSGSVAGSASQAPGTEEVVTFNFDFASKVKLLGIDSLLTGTAAFDPSGIYDPEGPIGERYATQDIQMPYPIAVVGELSSDPGISGTIKLKAELQHYFQDLDPAYDLIGEYYAGVELDFKEWGMPTGADDEQFYIAMRWPYNPVEAREKYNKNNSATESIKSEVLKKFIKMYNLNEKDLIGTPEDYKKRKVLVYNPEKKLAVVCTPAYFLWGEQDVETNAGLAAIVSPDAAYFLGLLIDDKGRIIAPMEDIGAVGISGRKSIRQYIYGGKKSNTMYVYICSRLYSSWSCY